MVDEIQELLNKGDKCMREGVFTWFTGGPNFGQAAQLYTSAAIKYKMKKMWPEAAQCYVKAAFAYEKTGEYHSQATAYCDSASMMKKYSTSEAEQYYNMAVDIYNSQGRFATSAKIYKGIAEVYEGEANGAAAMEYFKKAADHFDMDDHSKSLYSQTIQKYAEYAAKDFNKLSEAIKIFEKEGQAALRNNLIQFSAKEHFLKAGILHMAVADEVNAKIACERYGEIDPRFNSSREGKLLKDCVAAFEQKDCDAFVQAIHEFDSISRLDAWKVHFLYKIKQQMQGGGMAEDIQVDYDGAIDLS